MKVGFLKKAIEKQDAVLLIFLFATVIPLLFVSFYNQPSTDDYGCTTVIQEKGFWETQKYFYLNWNGRYFATIMASLNPLVFHSFTGYKLTSVFLIVLFVLAIYWLVSLIFTESNKIFKWGITSVGVFVYFLHLPDLAQGLFWMSGSLTYQTAAILTILLLGCVVKFLQTGRKIFFLYSILASLAVIGTNEVSMLYTDIIVLFMIVGNTMLNKKMNYYLLTLLLCTALFSSALIFAPGNAVRGGYYPLQHQFFKSVQDSYNLGVPYLSRWLRENIWIYFIIFSFFFTSEIPEVTAKLWVRPKLIPVFIFCICIPFIGIFTGFWSMGVSPPLRTINVPYFYFLLGIICFLFLLAVHLRERLDFTKDINSSGAKLILVIIVICFTIIKPNNLKMVYDDIVSGRVTGYNSQMEQRRDFISKCNGEICKIQPIADVPKTLYFEDITADTSDWKNKIFDKYYGKNCVLVK